MWPGPVTTVEVLTQPAAIRGPRGPTSTRTPAQFGDHVIMFLKLSAKLYTSVFHHGLKVSSLQRGTSWADSSAEEERSPWGSGQRVPPKAGTLCLSLSASCLHPSTGRNKWASSNHVYISDRGSRGRRPHSESSPISTLVLPIKNHVCVNQAWWPVPVIPSLRRLRQENLRSSSPAWPT